MKKLVRKLLFLRKRDEGASAVEYGLLVALIAVVVAAGAAAIGTALLGTFNSTADCVATPSTGCGGGGGGG